MKKKFCMPWILCFVCSHVLVILSFVCQGWVVVVESSMYSSSGVSGGGVWGLGRVAVEVCMQMAVVVRACIQQFEPITSAVIVRTNEYAYG